MGYVGLPLAIAAQKAGWKIFGLDTNHSRVDQLRNGSSYVEDVSNEVLKSALSKGFTPSTDFSIISECSIVVICVPTPLSESGEPDLSFLLKATASVAAFANSGTLVINESTSFPRTVRDLIPNEISAVREDLQLLYAVAPERVDPANSSWNYRNTPRLVSGLTAEATELARNFYASFCDQVVIVSSPEVAELSKLIENSFRQVNIALMNELVPIAKALNVDIFEVIRSATSKPYGFMPFYPGVGVGGHCIPVDPMYLSWAANKFGFKTSLIDAAQKINNLMPHYVAKLAVTTRTSTANKVLVVGLSYKPGVADLRESPSVELIKLLNSEFEYVDFWDGIVENWNGEIRSKLIDKYDLVIVTQRVVDEDVLAAISSAERVIDCTGQFTSLPNVETF